MARQTSDPGRPLLRLRYIQRTKENAVTYATHRTAITRSSGPHSADTHGITKREANVDSSPRTPVRRSTTPCSNPDCNSSEEAIWTEDYNYIRPSKSSFRDEAYREKYKSTHPMLHALTQAVTYCINRHRQLERCQTNHPRS